jgi:hypothetical protein
MSDMAVNASWLVYLPVIGNDGSNLISIKLIIFLDFSLSIKRKLI